jgi:hypothetical protein
MHPQLLQAECAMTYATSHAGAMSFSTDRNKTRQCEGRYHTWPEPHGTASDERASAEFRQTNRTKPG